MQTTRTKPALNRGTSTSLIVCAALPHVSAVSRSTKLPFVGLHEPVMIQRKGTRVPASFSPASGGGFALDSDQQSLQASAGLQRNLSFLAFWLQLALSISAAGVLFFAVGFTVPNPRSPTGPAMDLSKVLSLVGIALAFVSSFFAHGFLNLAHKLQAGQSVSRAWITRSLITNNTLNLAGIMATAVALQASVGTLVAKSLMVSAMGVQQYSSNPSTLVSIDVFGLQASTNSLLCHIVSLVFTNIMLRILTPKAPDTPLHTSTPPPPTPMYTPGASAPPYSSTGYSSSGYTPSAYSTPDYPSSSGYSPSAYPPPPTYNSPTQPPLRG